MAYLIWICNKFAVELKINNMFGYQFPTWLPVLFFITLLLVSTVVGMWLVKNDKNYKGIGRK